MRRVAEQITTNRPESAIETSNRLAERALSECLPIPVETGEVVMASNGDDPWKRHEARKKQQKEEDAFRSEYGQPWHLWNVVEGLIAYFYAIVVYNHYLKDLTILSAAGTAAFFMSALAPFIFPFLVGFCGARYLSAMFLKSNALYMVAHLFLGLSALVVMFSPLVVIAGLATASGATFMSGCYMMAGALTGYLTRHTRDQ